MPDSTCSNVGTSLARSAVYVNGNHVWTLPSILSAAAFAKKVLESGAEPLIDGWARQHKPFLNTYKAELRALGQELEARYFAGDLSCGHREFLTPIILFHWNRAGLAAVVQGAVAAAMDELLNEMIHHGHIAFGI